MMDLKELHDPGWPMRQMAVLAALQQRHATVQKLQAEELDAIRTKNAELQKQLDIDRATRAERMAEWDLRIE